MIPIGLTLFIAFLWSLSPLLEKVLLGGLPMEAILILLALVYIICTFFYYIWHRKKVNEAIVNLQWKYVGIILVAAIVGAFIPNILFLKVLSNHDSYIVTSLTYLSPMFTMALAYWFLRENISLWSFFGVVLIVTGIIFIIIHEHRKDILDEQYEFLG